MEVLCSIPRKVRMCLGLPPNNLPLHNRVICVESPGVLEVCSAEGLR